MSVHRSRARAAALGVALAAVVGCRPTPVPAAGAKTVDAGSAVAVDAGSAVHPIAIRGMLFVPEHLQVNVGDRIRWTNEDLVPHTVTAASKVFDSSIIAAGASFEWVATGTGEIPYACLIHVTMKGVLTVH